jgi:ADP-heptose:LPS heptosyltransferase
LKTWFQAPGKLLLVNPNASDLCLERRWPGERFVEVLSQLLDQMENLHVAFSGSPAERPYVSTLHFQLSRYGERVRNLAGELSLGGLLALLERTDCFLTNDSGPMHMGFALGLPTVALFGPGHPLHYAAHSEPTKTVVLYESIICSPCLYHSDFPPCGGDNQCMKLVEPVSVVKACLALLLHLETPQGPLPQSWQYPQEVPRVSSSAGLPLGRIMPRPFFKK